MTIRFGPLVLYWTAAFIVPASTSYAKEPIPLHRKTTEEILKNYTISADFTVKSEIRDNSDELFWKYAFKIPVPRMEYMVDFDDIEIELPRTMGDGPPYMHLNKGRVLFLKGDIRGARNTWLSNRARHGISYPHSRRNDYFISIAMLREAIADEKEAAITGKNINTEAGFANVSTFLSYTYMLREANRDSAVDFAAPKGFYNMAAIYFNHKRYAAAFGAAVSGLQYLKSVGNKRFRSALRRVKSEAYIKNRDYYSAVQELDLGIRQSKDSQLSAAMFARIGDMFFDLNNYELSEDMYALANRLDRDLNLIHPAQFVLRGEALFWLGQFSESQKMLEFAVGTMTRKNVVTPMSQDMASFAKLRFADGYLARKMYEEAKLEYYRIETEYRGMPAAKLAKIRRACLELPQYKGRNVSHARSLLESMKKETLTPEATELSWACQVASYAKRDRTEDMLQRVNAFSKRFPKSRFLAALVEPVRNYQTSKFKSYFAKGPYHGLAFYEATKDLLFKKLTAPQKQALFTAYVDVNKPNRAAAFWNKDSKKTKELTLLREVAFLGEMADANPTQKVWRQRSKNISKVLLTMDWDKKQSSKKKQYVQRIQNSGQHKTHIPWLYNLIKSWSAADSANICDFYYPMASSVVSVGKNIALIKRVKKDMSVLLEKNGEAFLLTQPYCMMSLLDLEAKILDKEPSRLARRYLARTKWQMNGQIASMYWFLSEKVSKNGDKKLAKKLWKTLVEKGPKGSPEVNFAKLRLDNKKTEFEDMWN